ncbi:PucR family transcriptional regulator [Arthrobacter sp. CAN_C5]|uniref:helix-turn-helix domain-containing protein n=1 Tax=Arthrobacter sp. CAN_C5 TaxID=2760706 RepID=UPI001AE281B9|nr:PucR family transcriptional regulator [Arthrobacter sp. CAN_C5]MBP2216938.1 sugar diacid utilization regulator [Arthrobacter sp. CAN_C5]
MQRDLRPGHPRSLSIAALCEDETLRLDVLLGDKNALAAEIAWLHVTELPDPSRYIRPTELVLTNGLWLEQTSSEDFVRAVAAAGAAGVVFGLTVLTRTVPEDLMRACGLAGLPLLSVPVDVPFAALTQAAARVQGEIQQESLLKALRRGDALTSVMSQGGGASGVLEVLAREFGFPLVLIDRRGTELAGSGDALPPAQLEAAAKVLARRPPPLEAEGIWPDPASLFLIVDAVGEVEAGLFCLRPHHLLTVEEQVALNQGARFLNLDVAQRQAIRAAESRFSGELLEMILSGSARVAEVPDRLRAFGIDPEGTLALLVFALADAPLPSDLDSDIEALVRSSRLLPVVAGGSQDIVVITSWSRGLESLLEFAESLRAELARAHPRRKLVVGVGEPGEGVGLLKEQLIRARAAANVLKRRKAGALTATAASLGTHSMLLALQRDATLSRFAAEELAAIRQHDLMRGTELEATLREFLNRNGHWASTAEALFLHVNTLRNRLDRIGSLTGRDMSNFADRVDLFLALEADAMS